MTPKETVLAKYPNARAERLPSIHQYGLAIPEELDRWIIYERIKHLGQMTELGVGLTEEQAWINAAAGVISDDDT